MRLTFLEAEVPSTKTFKLDENGELQKIGHPRVIDYTSHWRDAGDIAQFCDVMQEHADKGHCLLKGNVARELKWESRAGSTDPNAETQWVCYDIDGFKDLDEPGAFMEMIGFGDVDRIEQYSASSGIVEGRGLSAHVFCMLPRPMAAPLLKQYLISMNLNNPRLRSALELTSTTNSLRYILDVTTCQNDKLIYIAPPILGPGVKDGFKGKRIRLVRGKKRFVEFTGFPSAEANQAESRKVLNELRAKRGLAERAKWTYKSDSGVEVLTAPTQAVVTGIKKERGFVYLNLNGGDSFAYYHPEGNPKIIKNFKGEDNYYTKDLLPEYWATVQKEVNAPRQDEENMYLAFCDWRTSVYWKGIYNKKTQDLDMAEARGPNQLRDFLLENGQPVGEYTPTWDLVYAPDSEKIIDLEAPKRPRVNIFKPSEFHKLPRRSVPVVPKLFHKILIHAMGDDEQASDHLLNWMAVLLRYPGPVGTAWCWHGVQGTGKGVILNDVLRWVFGESNVTARRPIELDSQFNGFIERSRILWIEEADADAGTYANAEVMDQSLKNYITEPTVTARHMYAVGRSVPNWLGVIVSSNKTKPVILPPDDRRWNIGAFQTQKIHARYGGWLTTEQIEVDLKAELSDIYEYLLTREADKERAKTALHNSAKAEMIKINRPAIDQAIDAILSGNVAFFKDHLPGGKIPSLSGFDQNVINDYVQLVGEMTKWPNLTRSELYILLNYLVGGMPAAPGKFMSILKHHNIKEMVSIRRGNDVLRGINIKWRTPE